MAIRKRIWLGITFVLRGCIGLVSAAGRLDACLGLLVPFEYPQASLPPNPAPLLPPRSGLQSARTTAPFTMEVVGGVSSVATLLELTSKFLLYLKDVKHGPADRARLIAELDSTKHLLEQLQNRIKNLPTVGDDVTSKSTAFMTSLVIQSGPFDQCEKILNALLKKVGNTSSGQQRRFRDRFKKAVGNYPSLAIR